MTEKEKFTTSLNTAKAQIEEAKNLFMQLAHHAPAFHKACGEAKELQEQLAYTIGDLGNLGGFDKLYNMLVELFHLLGDIDNPAVFPCEEKFVDAAAKCIKADNERRDIVDLIKSVLSGDYNEDDDEDEEESDGKD